MLVEGVVGNVGEEEPETAGSGIGGRVNPLEHAQLGLVQILLGPVALLAYPGERTVEGAQGLGAVRVSKNLEKAWL